MSSAFIIHTDFDEINTEIAKLQGIDKTNQDEIIAFTDSLRDIAFKVEPAMKRESHEDERQLWREYQQLQQEKLILLDLKHEYEDLGEKIKDKNPRLDFLIKDTLEELSDHIIVLAETHRAHIDILEILNTRRIEVLALIITTVISYLAVWEFFVRDLLAGIIFPYHLTPNLNYLLILVALLPVFIAVSWAWRNRGKRF